MDEPWQGHPVVLRHAEAGDNNERNGLVVEGRSLRAKLYLRRLAMARRGNSGIILRRV
jgi:hypothetical protein